LQAWQALHSVIGSFEMSGHDDKSPMDHPNNRVKAVLLVGGLGTRLRSVVPSAPKPLASVCGRPFLELLIQQLSYQGIRRLVLCTGYRAEDIQSQLGDGSRWDITIEYSKESSPMGTAGAIKLAEPFLQDASDFLVMNGDSFLEIDFRKLIEFHHVSAAIASMAVLRTEDTTRYGTVQVTGEGRVSSFAEKVHGSAAGLVNAGIYVFDRRIFGHLPAGPASLERDVFPKLLEQGVYAFEQRGVFIDIGTPEDYARAQDVCNRFFESTRK
jgi:D-glycero-alpha-D-manno-heptose 1-phosphate guanylyltransferase